MPKDDHIARICKSSALEDGRPGPAAFEFRKEKESDKFKEKELSVHWVEHHNAPLPLENKLAALARFLLKPVIPSELKIRNESFAVVPVQVLHKAEKEIQGTVTTFTCAHTPRTTQEEDSHSSVFPHPGVDLWPNPNTEKGEAYHFAVRKFLADNALSKAHKIKDLAAPKEN